MISRPHADSVAPVGALPEITSDNIARQSMNIEECVEYFRTMVRIDLSGPAAESHCRKPDSQGFVRLRSPRDLVATHESGHIVAVLDSGRFVAYATIEPKFSFAQSSPQRYSAGHIRWTVDQNPLPEQTAIDDDPARELQTDQERARALPCRVLAEYFGRSLDDVFEECLRDAEAFVERHWLLIKTFSVELVRHSTIYGPRINEIYSKREQIRAFYESLERRRGTEMAAPIQLKREAVKGALASASSPLAREEADFAPKVKPGTIPWLNEAGRTKQVLIAYELGWDK